jgi:transposase InsO family protein
VGIVARHLGEESPTAPRPKVRVFRKGTLSPVFEYIQPGKPQQNAYVERYNRAVRYDWLGQTLFDSIEDAQESATRWLWTYNHERPNMAIGGITPMQKLALAA